MTSILVTNNKGNTIAEICGKATIDKDILFISVNPTQKALALKLVLQSTDIRFDRNMLIIPTNRIYYASNYADNDVDKEHIRFIEK